MKTVFSFIFCFIFVFSLLLKGEIIETAHFCEILKHVKPTTLLVLDIDDTLLVPVQTLGTDVWFQHRVKQLSSELEKSAAFRKALSEWEGIRHLTEVRIVEEGSEAIVAELQKRGIAVIALTTQAHTLAYQTCRQLISLGFDMTKTALSTEDIYFSFNPGVLYHQGILFTSGNPKGKCLLKLCEVINYKPKHVLFINDKESHLKDLQGPLVAKEISYTGLRYSYGDKRVTAFSPEIAEIQWKHSTFEHILSDQEAKELLLKCSTN